MFISTNEDRINQQKEIQKLSRILGKFNHSGYGQKEELVPAALASAHSTSQPRKRDVRLITSSSNFNLKTRSFWRVCGRFVIHSFIHAVHCAKVWPLPIYR